MEVDVAAPATAFLVFLLGASSALGKLEVSEPSTEIDQSSCNSTSYFSVRSAWASEDEPCHQKLSLDTWAFMKAKGSAQDADAEHVYVECLRQPEIGLVELSTPKDWNSTIVGEAPGEIMSESEHAATLLCKGVKDFEAICDDEEVSKATRVRSTVDSSVPFRRIPRHLQSTTSEAGAAHQVDELIQGLKDLGCLRTTGEDQTLCVLSDSFDNNGAAASLQASGDLPLVDVVKDLTTGDGSDEGSAMIELAFDIASGATYKFNSAFLGQQTFADDIGVLADAEECDVIVDDIGYYASPSFRDGVISSAVDAATQDHDVLYFTSAGNAGFGHRFVSDWECQTVLFSDDVLAPCTSGVSAHVFDSSSTTESRYLLPFVSTSTSPVHIKWDDDEGSAREMDIIIWAYSFSSGYDIYAMDTSDPGSATVSLPAPGDDQEYFISVHRIGGDSLEAIDMHLVSAGNYFTASGTTATSGAMYGQPCATNAFSVAAIPYSRASGDGGAFADPEPSSVEDFSSRGPCIVNAGQGLSTRNHPVTTAADALETSTSGFNPFYGTSAAAPVAAAIATIIRAACFPRVVTYSDMMEMLTDYEYTIDATSDADGATETFGAEAGYGVISAHQMCLWVAHNCPETCPNSGVGAHGDPHLVGIAGQKFDFTGQSNTWFALLSAWGTDHVNMRVTAPIADLAVVTYITGISVQTEDDEGVGHSIVIFVSDPTEFETRCPEDCQMCIGDGALTVLLDGVLVGSPGEKELGPGVSFMAANIPGECRPFGFERYWQQKVREAELLSTEMGRRRLMHVPSADRWIAEDQSATNPTECREYVSNAMEHESLFTHQSDHVSFQLVTPHLTLRLNHGKLHQLPERDPNDTFDIPDHTTFQMNMGFLEMTRDDTMQGVIGETSVPTVDENGDKIMSGLKAIRGSEKDYKVDGPLGKQFEQLRTGV